MLISNMNIVVDKLFVESIDIDQLSDKNYQDLYDIESPDFVLMFIPIEPAFAVVVNEDNSIYNKEYAKKMVQFYS